MDPHAQRLTALWKSGRDKYRSFFTVLNEVRREIGDDALGDWCRNELRIGLSVILDVRKLLNKTDSEVVRAELATANKAEREKAKLERIAKEQLKRNLRAKTSNKKFTGKMLKARAIVRSLMEQHKKVDPKALAKTHAGMSHDLWEKAEYIERALILEGNHQPCQKEAAE
jgi:hypothetical protein